MGLGFKALQDLGLAGFSGFNCRLQGVGLGFEAFMA